MKNQKNIFSSIFFYSLAVVLTIVWAYLVKNHTLQSQPLIPSFLTIPGFILGLIVIFGIFYSFKSLSHKESVLMSCFLIIIGIVILLLPILLSSYSFWSLVYLVYPK
jgi:hypothetical protein